MWIPCVLIRPAPLKGRWQLNLSIAYLIIFLRKPSKIILSAYMQNSGTHPTAQAIRKAYGSWSIRKTLFLSQEWSMGSHAYSTLEPSFSVLLKCSFKENPAAVVEAARGSLQCKSWLIVQNRSACRNWICLKILKGCGQWDYRPHSLKGLPDTLEHPQEEWISKSSLVVALWRSLISLNSWLRKYELHRLFKISWWSISGSSRRNSYL